MNDENIKSKLAHNRISFIVDNEDKFDEHNEYDKMSKSEKYFLSDFENAIDLFGK